MVAFPPMAFSALWPPSALPTSKSMNHRSWVLLSLIVAAGFAVRVAALAYWQTGAIENEGAEYIRLAENLREGIGFVGIAMPGTQLLFNPLFPLLIAAASFVTGNYEWAARLVSLVLGALLPLPVFGITSRLFNRRVGLIAALLTILHPLLVSLSLTGFSEGPYTTLLLSAVYVTVRAIDHPSTKLWSFVGAAFGLAYLLRAEAVAAFLIAVGFAFAAIECGTTAKCKRAVAAIGIFLVIALPEVILIYRSTGKALLEGKSTVFFEIGTRILSAEKSLEVDHKLPDGQQVESYHTSNMILGPEQLFDSAAFKWAQYAVDTNVRPTGTTMRTNAEVIRETSITLKETFHLVEEAMRRKASLMVHELSRSWIVPPFVLALLGILGTLRQPWRRPQASSRLFVMLIPVAPVVATISAFWTEPRYYFVLVPLLLIWASNGLIEVGLWTKAASAALGWKAGTGPVVSKYIIPGLIGAAIVILPLKGVRALDYFTSGSPSRRIEKDVGLWIGRQQIRPVRIIDLAYGLSLAVHADAQHVQFPYCNGDLALRFLDAAQVDYVVLRRGESFTPILRGLVDTRHSRPPGRTCARVSGH